MQNYDIGTANLINLQTTENNFFVDGKSFLFKANSTNTGDTYITVNGSSERQVMVNGLALVGGEIVEGEFITLVANTEFGTFDLLTSGTGGDKNNLGYFATQAALETAYPTAVSGNFAIVGTTDTIWVWDEDTTAWISSTPTGGGGSSILETQIFS